MRPAERAELTAVDRAALADWSGDLGELIESRISRLLPSEWAERKRILPPGLTSLPGRFRWETTPYLREIIDAFAPASPVQKVVVMKGAQLGFSVGVLENLIGWIIDCEPGPTLFVTADKELAESVVETRVDKMIESAGIGGKIFAQVQKTHGRKTGDTKSKKEFPGGFLLPIGPNTGAKLRSYSIKTILFDELDGFPLEVQKEGDPIALAERRTDAFSRNRKIFYNSTPTIEGTSRIKPLFEAGDQRKYFVPCKVCGAMQELRFDRLKYAEDELGRLVWESVHYECEACGAAWKNDDKAHFLALGEWRPTATPTEPGLRSYHLSSLYSPIGFRSWESIAQEWIACKGDPTKLRAFVNTVLGETWQERGEAPRYERIMLRREEYAPGEWPAGGILCTMGADVQADRIEAEIVAWGDRKESWSLGYHVFEGDTSDLQGPAWTGLQNLLLTRPGGRPIVLALVDAGFRTNTVYQFCEQFAGGVLPCMGESAQSYGRRLFALRDCAGFAVKRADLQTGQLKAELYGYLARGAPADGQPTPDGYCHFPAEYGEKYFRMLTAEERVKETTRTGAVRYVWKLGSGRRNEALDARVYAMGALYVFASMIQEEAEAEGVTWPEFWAWARSAIN